MMKSRESAYEGPLSKRFRADPEKRLEFLPGQMIVKIKGDALEPAAGALRGGGARLAARVTRALPESVTGPLDYLTANAGLGRATPLFVDTGKGVQGLTKARAAAVQSVAASPHEDLRGYTVVAVDPKKVSGKVMKHVARSKAIEYVEPMPARWIARRATGSTVDPMQNLQWALRAIGWFDAKLPSATAVKRIKVAVLDTGIDRRHPDLKSAIASYEHGGTSAEDLLGHGTHVAGIISAHINNGVGISGVAGCRLAIWKIFDDRPIAGESYVNGEAYLRALGLLVDEGCSIVNLSIGGTQQSRTEAILFRRLRDRNIVPIAAMGNEFQEGDPTEFPAAYPGVIAVGAISSELRRASFSNTGRHIWVMAPGQSILSTAPTDASRYRDETEYAEWSGTSMATPYVAGCVALYRAKHPTATADRVERALERGVKRLPQMNGRAFTVAHGYGLVYLPKLL